MREWKGERRQRDRKKERWKERDWTEDCPGVPGGRGQKNKNMKQPFIVKHCDESFSQEAAGIASEVGWKGVEIEANCSPFDLVAAAG